MKRLLLAGLAGGLLSGVWIGLAQLGVLGLSQPGFLASQVPLVLGGLVTSVLAAMVGQLLGARSRDRGGNKATEITVPAPQKVPQKTLAPAELAGKPTRSEAITLLASLQREARFVDLVQETLTDYSDAQVGAAARDVLRDCRTVLDRYFDLCPVIDQPEGSAVEIPVDQEAGRIRISKSEQSGTSSHASLVHHGWEARRCQLPKWSGSKEMTFLIVPAELEVK